MGKGGMDSVSEMGARKKHCFEQFSKMLLLKLFQICKVNEYGQRMSCGVGINTQCCRLRVHAQ